MPRYVFLDPQLFLSPRLGNKNPLDFIWDLKRPSHDQEIKESVDKLNSIAGSYKLTHGLILLNLLNDLVENHEFQIIFFSELSLDIQDFIYQGLEKCIKEAGLPALKLAFQTYDISSMKIKPCLSSPQDHVPIIQWGGEKDGTKNSLRESLKEYFEMRDEDIHQSLILDANPEVIKFSITDGFQTASSVKEFCERLKTDIAKTSLIQINECPQHEPQIYNFPVEVSSKSDCDAETGLKFKTYTSINALINTLYRQGYEYPTIIDTLKSLSSNYRCNKINKQEFDRFLKQSLEMFILELKQNFWQPFELSCYLFNCILGIISFIILSPILLLEGDLRQEHYQTFFSLPYENVSNLLNKHCSVNFGFSLS